MKTQPTPGHIGLRSRQRYSARPFVLSVGVICFLALVSWTFQGNGDAVALSSTHDLSKRGLLKRDEDCHLVHKAVDKCAFVHANCPDEEAGIFSYLSLYYCHLPHAQPVAFIILVLWLSLLFSTIGIAASDFFCVNLSTIATLLGMSESMAGVTFLAFGNGSPDVFSTFAAMNSNSASLAIGELVGAAGFITAVVAGSMALVRPFKVARKSFVRDVVFFIVAASFSMVFIWDGKLSLWESATMVGFYVFYVCFVMTWHWWLGLRNKRRRRTATMRSHFVVAGGEEEVPQEYHDEEVDGPSTSGTRTPGGVSEDDFAELERAGGEISIEEDDNEEIRERWLGELNNNMRLRPSIGSRRNTHTPIRPSLVGALEFRAVLTSLQKSRNIQSMPIGLRRYSDDPTYTTAQQQDLISTTSDPAPRPPYDVEPEDTGHTPQTLRPHSDIKRHFGNRTRAVSTNDIDNIQAEAGSFIPSVIPSIDFAPASPDDKRHVPLGEQPLPSPSISLSPPPSEHPSRATTPTPSTMRQSSPDRLAPPGLDVPGSRSPRQLSPGPSPLSSPPAGPSSRHSPRPPKIIVPGTSSPPLPFPPYTDYPLSAHSSMRAPSLRLPSPSASPESLFHPEHLLGTGDHKKAPQWWPTAILPPPHIFWSTLFPTLANWKDKNTWERILGIVAAPSVFLLTVTLPVVETQKDDDLTDEDIVSSSLSLPPPLTPAGSNLGSNQRSIITGIEPENRAQVNSSNSKAGSTIRTSISTATPAGADQPNGSITNDRFIVHSPEQLPTIPSPSESKHWNRWLVITQAFTAPFFVVLIIWANTEIEYPRILLRNTLYSLVFSLIVLAVLLTTTTPTRPPRWRTLLCFMGFAVSIAWISSIANEVVGVLKTLGVIMNMSDAILGLTIFAVGNSLGDFVADITVARLGFPVMALSACFGGPMLNILLGIGISGCYITIKGGQRHHKKHPDKPMRFEPYPIEISTTLVISGATLLATLVGLLVAVPWRKWRMDKAIGWGLVALWCASTLANVIVEVLGLSSKVT